MSFRFSPRFVASCLRRHQPGFSPGEGAPSLRASCLQVEQNGTGLSLRSNGHGCGGRLARRLLTYHPESGLTRSRPHRRVGHPTKTRQDPHDGRRPALSDPMKNAKLYARWFIAGMGSIIGISQTIPPIRGTYTGVEAFQGDINAVGSDFRSVIDRYPATKETAKSLLVGS